MDQRLLAGGAVGVLGLLLAAGGTAVWIDSGDSGESEYDIPDGLEDFDGEAPQIVDDSSFNYDIQRSSLKTEQNITIEMTGLDGNQEYVFGFVAGDKFIPQSNFTTAPNGAHNLDYNLEPVEDSITFDYDKGGYQHFLYKKNGTLEQSVPMYSGIIYDRFDTLGYTGDNRGDLNFYSVEDSKFTDTLDTSEKTFSNLYDEDYYRIHLNGSETYSETSSRNKTGSETFNLGSTTGYSWSVPQDADELSMSVNPADRTTITVTDQDGNILAQAEDTYSASFGSIDLEGVTSVGVSGGSWYIDKINVNYYDEAVGETKAGITSEYGITEGQTSLVNISTDAENTDVSINNESFEGVYQNTTGDIDGVLKFTYKGDELIIRYPDGTQESQNIDYEEVYWAVNSYGREENCCSSPPNTTMTVYSHSVVPNYMVEDMESPVAVNTTESLNLEDYRINSQGNIGLKFRADESSNFSSFLPEDSTQYIEVQNNDKGELKFLEFRVGDGSGIVQSLMSLFR